MGKLFIGNKAVGEFDAARVTGQHIQLNNFVSFDAAPQLNENQQILLEWLKSTWVEKKNMHWFPFEVINLLSHQFDTAWESSTYKEFAQVEQDEPHIKAYGAMTALEQLPVMQAFSQWAQEQEAE